MGTFGDKFRKAREAKKLSYDDVSRVTKIGARMLQAIEDEHFDQLPGGVFNKGFIRAYAKHLGLNDEEAVTDYLAALRQAQIDANEFRDPHIPAVRPPAVPERRTQPMTATPAPQAKPPAPTPQHVKAPVQVVDAELPHLQLPRAEDLRPRRQYPGGREAVISGRLITVAALVVTLAVAFFWTRHTRVTRTEAASTGAKPAPATSQSPGSSAAAIAPTTTAPAHPIPTPSSASSTNLSAPEAQPSAAPANSPDATKTAPATPTGKTPAESDVTVRVPTKLTPETKSAPPMTLVIRATENSWISVQADGQLVSQETLIAPASTTVRATREITVKVGNAAGISFLWNKQEIPAQGVESEAKTLVFDAQGMRAANQ